MEASLSPLESNLFQASFDSVVAQYQTHVYNVCYRILGEAQAAQDASQETFLAAWRTNLSEAFPNSVRAWLSCIASNKSIDEIRRRNRQRGPSLEASIEAGLLEPAANGWTPDFAAVNAELREQLQQGLAALPYKQRRAVVLRDVEGLSYDAIAQATGVSVGTVKSRISRGRKGLRTLVAADVGTL